MGRQLILLLMKIYLTLGAMQVHGSAGNVFDFLCSELGFILNYA